MAPECSESVDLESWGLLHQYEAWATTECLELGRLHDVARQCLGETSLAAESVVQESHRYPQNVSTLTCTSVAKW